MLELAGQSRLDPLVSATMDQEVSIPVRTTRSFHRRAPDALGTR